MVCVILCRKSLIIFQKYATKHIVFSLKNLPRISIIRIWFWLVDFLPSLFPSLFLSFFNFFDRYLTIAQWAFVKGILDFGSKPVINTFSMENMSAGWNLSYIYSFLKVFKADHTFILLELIHTLIEFFLLDEWNKSIESLLHLYCFILCRFPLCSNLLSPVQ